MILWFKLKKMNIHAEKLGLIEWIISLKDVAVIENLKKSTFKMKLQMIGTMKFQLKKSNQ